MERLDVSILGRDYTLACASNQKETLAAAARHVDQRMQSIKGSGKITGNERIAVMAAIQIAAELLAMRAPDGPLANVALGDFKRKVDGIHQLLDQIPGLPSVGRS